MLFLEVLEKVAFTYEILHFCTFSTISGTFFYLMFSNVLLRRFLLFSLSKVIDFAAPTLENSLGKSVTLAVPDAKSTSKIKGKP